MERKRREGRKEGNFGRQKLDETIAMQSVSKFSGARGNPDERRIASEGKEEEEEHGEVNGGRPLSSVESDHK